MNSKFFIVLGITFMASDMAMERDSVVVKLNPPSPTLAAMSKSQCEKYKLGRDAVRKLYFHISKEYPNQLNSIHTKLEKTFPNRNVDSIAKDNGRFDPADEKFVEEFGNIIKSNEEIDTNDQEISSLLDTGKANLREYRIASKKLSDYLREKEEEFLAKGGVIKLFDEQETN